MVAKIIVRIKYSDQLNLRYYLFHPLLLGTHINLADFVSILIKSQAQIENTNIVHPKEFYCFLVALDLPSFLRSAIDCAYWDLFGKLEKKMGWRNQPTSMLFFENCRVPVTNRVGAEGTGFKIALNALNGGRINIAACSLGGAMACLRLTQSYMHERKQFGKSLTEMQALRFYFADMVTDFEAARLMVYRAADALDKAHPDAPMYCAMAKRLATDTAFRISDKAMQLHGGYGYLRDYQIERIFRDLRVHQILEGTNEIMREIIAKAALDKDYCIV